MKIKFLFFVILLFFIYTVFGNQTTQKLYYFDNDNNGKIDNIFIDFGEEIYGNLNYEKIFLYSNTGGLSSNIIDSENLFLNYEIDKNILKLSFEEKDLEKLSLNISNTTSGELRLKTNSGVGIFYKNSNEEVKILYTSSFDNYKNVFYDNPFGDSDNGEILEENTNSGIILEENSSSGEINTENPVYNEDNFDFILNFQNPSYILEKDLIKDEYLCDNSKTDCRINFNLGILKDNIFQELSDDFICKWNFGDEIGLQEINKCNPNTIIFLGEQNNIFFEIFDKNNNKLFQRNLLISKNNQTQTGEVVEENTNSGIILDENSNSGETNTENPVYNEDSFDFILNFQNPSYILEKDLIKDEYLCDNSKTDCRVNLEIQQILNNEKFGISTSNFNCKIFLNSQDYSQEIEKCNPSTLVLPIGEISLRYEIFSNQNNSKLFSKNIIIKNSGYQKPTQSYSYSSKTYDVVVAKNELQTPFIKIQSGLDNNNFCLKKDCTINLIYENTDKNILCEWDFGDVEFTFGDQNKCNPGYLKLNNKNHNIILKIYDKNNPFNYKTSNILIENSYFSNEIITENNKKELFNLSQKIDIVQKNETVKKSYLRKLEFNNILPNPSGKDKYEFIEIKNISQENIDLNGCKIIENNSGKNYKINQILPAFQTFKFYNYQTKISLNNTKGFNLELNCFDEKIDDFSWNKKSLDNMILHKNILNYEIEDIQKDEKNILLKTNSGVISKPIYVDNPLLVLKNSSIENSLKQELAAEILNDNFTQKISKNKSGIKVYGKTIPNLKLVFTLEKIGNEFSFFPKVYANNYVFNTKSDLYGNYEFFIKTPMSGNFKINNFVEISQDKSLELELKNDLEIENEYIEYLNEKSFKKQDIYTDFNIILQTKSSKNNKIQNKKIICLKTECSVNFDVNNKLKNYKYLWNFGNGITFEGTNPSFVKFNSGNYIVELQVIGDDFQKTDYFLVEVAFEKLKPQKSESTPVLKEIKNPISEEVLLQSNKFLGKELILSLLIFFNFLLLSFLVLKNKKLI